MKKLDLKKIKKEDIYIGNIFMIEKVFDTLIEKVISINPQINDLSQICYRLLVKTNAMLIKVDDNNYLTGIVKKEDSSYANLLGRYLLNKKVFTVKDKLKYYANNELYLPHALLNFNGEVKAVWYNDEYFNIGEKLGFIKASIHYGLKNNDYKEELINYLKSVNKKLK